MLQMQAKRLLEEELPWVEKKPSISYLNVVEACLVKIYNDKGIIDSGAINHVCYSL